MFHDLVAHLVACSDPWIGFSDHAGLFGGGLANDYNAESFEKALKSAQK
jgi:hypothetical protein